MTKFLSLKLVKEEHGNIMLRISSEIREKFPHCFPIMNINKLGVRVQDLQFTELAVCLINEIVFLS